MPVAVNMPTRQPQADPLDKLAAAVNIARTVYGIHVDAKGLEDMKLKREQEASDRKTKEEQRGIENKRADEELDLKKKTFIMTKGDEETQALSKKKTLAEIAKLYSDASKARGESKAGKVIPASEAVAFGSADAAQQALNDSLKSIKDHSSIVGPFMGHVSNLAAMGEVGQMGKDAKALNAQLQINAQVIGKSLEGGKVTDQDIIRYRKMLPNLTDSPEAAQQKIEVLTTLIANKKAAEVSSLKSSGYDTGSLNTAGAPKAAGGGDHSLADLLAEKQKRSKTAGK